MCRPLSYLCPSHTTHRPASPHTEHGVNSKSYHPASPHSEHGRVNFDSHCPVSLHVNHGGVNSNTIEQQPLVTHPYHTQDTVLPLPYVPLPIAPISNKFEVLASDEIDKSKLANIDAVLQKYSALRTECKIGVLCVKLARETVSVIL